MIRASIVTILLMLLSPHAVPAQQLSKSEHLQLTMEVLQQRHCIPEYSDMYDIAMDLQLTYKNIGGENIILPKGELITYWRTGTDIYNLWAGDYGHIGWVTSGNGIMPNVGGKPDSRFVVLKPGESYKAKKSFTVSGLGKLDPGDHLLQIVVELWTGSYKQAERLRERWKKTGILTIKVKSEPMPFRVEKDVKLVKCQPAG
jgi:hypothetical protein